MQGRGWWNRRGRVLVLVAFAVTLLGSMSPVAAAPPGGGSGDDASFDSQTVPASLACGETASVSVTMRNSGKTTWTATGGYALQHTTGDSTWGTSVPVTADVGPRNRHTFTWTVTAPATAGTYNFGWTMAVNGTGFGAPTPVVGIAVSCGGAGGGGGTAAPLADLFEGRAQLVEDAAFSVDTPLVFRNGIGSPGHSETATVKLGPTYHMYFRTFVNEDGSKTSNGVPAGIALATSTDGHSWTVHNEGKPLIASRPSSATSGCQPSPCVISVYAPSVLVDGTEVRIVFETMDTGVVGPSSTPRHWIETATSTDGINWSPPQKILEATVPWEGYADGAHRGNVGTPQLTKEGDLYRLDYHGFSADSSQLARGLAVGTSLSDLTRSSSNPTFRPTPGWNSFGPGHGATTKEGEYWYRVFEGFKGSAQCGRTDTVVSWGIARSADLVTWEHSAANPIRTDRIAGSCGEDMPAWQVIDGLAPMVMTTNYDHPHASEATVKRYRIVAGAPGTSGRETVALATAATGGYWELGQDGGVDAFGGASSHGDATVPSGAALVDIAGRPDGSGYWVVASDGKVQAFGRAAHHGNGRRDTAAIEPTPTGGGYWVVDRNGTVRSFGDAVNRGSLTSAPSAPIVGIATTASGAGYWLVGGDGKIYPFGDAVHHGAVPGSRTDVVGMAVRPDGGGYWITAATGDVWAFNATMFGSTDGWVPSSPMRIVGIGPRGTGQGPGSGYHLVAADGATIDFGLAPYSGHVRGKGWNS